MSDTEDGEPFDKEAEKEKLRQQLEQEEENRRSTQHMSELLLKGATMTNKHCDACGDPLFRHDGREFCPTCGAGAEPEAAEGGVDGEVADQDVADPQEIQTGTGESADHSAEAGADATPDQASEAATPSRADVGTGDGVPQGAGSPAAGSAPSGDVGEARAALVRKLSALAREAEATDDVGRARELLAATREAAEALAAIDSLRG